MLARTELETELKALTKMCQEVERFRNRLPQGSSVRDQIEDVLIRLGEKRILLWHMIRTTPCVYCRGTGYRTDYETSTHYGDSPQDEEECDKGNMACTHHRCYHWTELERGTAHRA